MDIETVRFSHILEADTLACMEYFLTSTAFIVSHKSESIETLQGVLWYLPATSPILIVTNCLQEEIEHLRHRLKEQMTSHKKLYLVHQKDHRIAHLFRAYGVQHILDTDGRVRDGKGEGMYIGTLCAALLGYPRWVIYYDADNIVPCSLLEYTLAMGKLFLSARSPDLLWKREDMLHNIRICWASKPQVSNGKLEFQFLGRCTSVISPLFSTLLEEWFGIPNYPVVSSNAGEQGMTIKTAKTLRFSSHYSIETFQLLDFLSTAASGRQPCKSIVQQYQSKSPHFHTKRDDEHIRRMIAQSLGSFFAFHDYIPRYTQERLRRICDEMQLEICSPLIYPSLESLDIEDSDSLCIASSSETCEICRDAENNAHLVFSQQTFVNQYKLFCESESA
jgi:mannosyl-3-phosphoglycerate synthase